MKLRIVLDSEKSLGVGMLVKHCGKLQQINYDALKRGEWWECVDCKKPLVFVSDDGWYEIGNKIQF